jgi:predicted RNase H-like HicB family nuclease
MKASKILSKALSSPANQMSDYHINIFYSEEDGGYIADIPDLQACSAFGTTAAKALTELQIAKKAWIEAARASGKKIPAPRYRPAIYQVQAG